MKPFDLEKFLEDDVDIVTRDGRKVYDLTYFETEDPYCLVGILDGRIDTWTREGFYLDYDEYDQDIFFKEEKKEGWLVVPKFSSNYPKGYSWVAVVYPDQQEAEAQRLLSDVECVLHIEWE